MTEEGLGVERKGSWGWGAVERKWLWKAKHTCLQTMGGDLAAYTCWQGFLFCSPAPSATLSAFLEVYKKNMLILFPVVF